MGRTRWILPVVAALGAAGSSLPAQGREPAHDAEARALYDEMIATMRRARSLSWVSRYRWTGRDGREIGRCTYTARLAKPNRFRIDTERAEGGKGGVLIGDGDTMWMHWPQGRPFFSTEDPALRSEPRDRDYFQQRTPQGAHSIGHETVFLGAGMSMTILDPSTFHGYTDSLQPYLDGVTGKGSATLAESGEECDIVEVSFMKGQRTWELWLSRRDHLPRFLRQVVHVAYDIVTEEEWSEVEIDGELAPELFEWAPPEGYRRWFKPEAADRLLRPGEVAPDFVLTGRDGAPIRLSSFRGKVVWLNFWRVG